MDAETWVYRVKAEEGESFGHYLGRFCRANYLSHKVVADHLGINVSWVEEWESPSRRRQPTEPQLRAIAKLVDVAPEKLAKMLPPDCLHLQTRLCGACYGEVPVHRVVWQESGKAVCDRHGLYLLSVCPGCQSGFRTPALWLEKDCEDCGLPFSQMAESQERAGDVIAPE
jgi:transcriptional regulator with XRE-family HTH domain